MGGVRAKMETERAVGKYGAKIKGGARAVMQAWLSAGGAELIWGGAKEQMEIGRAVGGAVTLRAGLKQAWTCWVKESAKECGWGCRYPVSGLFQTHFS